MPKVKIKRIYELPDETDGARFLVDRIWPRGISKDKAKLTGWLKDIAPSPELRKRFCHIPERFAEFEARYRDELAGEEARSCLAELRKRLEDEDITLLYAAKEERFNNAVVLKKVLEQTDL